MIVLIDMDEVITDFETQLVKRWEEKYPHTLLFPNGVRDSFYIGSGEGDTRSELVSKLIHEEGFFESLEPLPGAIKAIEHIRSNGHSVFVVTSAGISYPYAASEKYRWIGRHLGKDMLERLVITPSKVIVRGDILIDDKPRIPHEEKAMWEHVLFDRSYNKDVQEKRRISWDTWDEVLTELV